MCVHMCVLITIFLISFLCSFRSWYRALLLALYPDPPMTTFWETKCISQLGYETSIPITFLSHRNIHFFTFYAPSTSAAGNTDLFSIYNLVNISRMVFHNTVYNIWDWLFSIWHKSCSWVAYSINILWFV